MKFPLHFLSIYGKSKRFLHQEELSSSIELLNKTIQKSGQDPKTKATINGILQSYNVNELAKARNLIEEEKYLKNRAMLAKNQRNLLNKLRRRFILWRYFWVISWTVLLWVTYSIYELHNYNNYIKLDYLDESQEEDALDPVAETENDGSKSIPLRFWTEAHERLRNQDNKRKITEEKLPIWSSQPMTILDDYENQKVILTPKNDVEPKEKSKLFGVCVGSFMEKNNAENLARNLKSSIVESIEKIRMHRVVLGNFRNIDLARKLKKKLLKSYPEAWVVTFSNN